MHSPPPLALTINVHHYVASGVSTNQLAYRQSNWLIAKSAVIVATQLLAHGGVSHEHASANVTVLSLWIENPENAVPFRC
jgi:hypothetical protein